MKKESNIINNNSQKEALKTKPKTLKKIRRKEPLVSRLNRNRGK